MVCALKENFMLSERKKEHILFEKEKGTRR
jgi:hypothetical protein